ncbi:MAG: hypothetical protein HZB77_00025 [Chloroflexi bacterium]|nr:hypothetical protein [Chloroflexota bacterium]
MLPPHEQFPFYFFQLNGSNFLARSDGAADLAALTESHFTPVFARYAFSQVNTLRPFFPTMAADDRGSLYRGLDAFDWIAESGVLFPRSDAMGVWSDGSEDQLFLRELDLAVLPLIYISPSAERFGERLAAAVEIVSDAAFAIAPAGGFPNRIAASVPTFQLNRDLVNHQGLQLLADQLE